MAKPYARPASDGHDGGGDHGWHMRQSELNGKPYARPGDDGQFNREAKASVPGVQKKENGSEIEQEIASFKMTL